MGLVLCSQAFLQAKDPDYTGLLSDFVWWKSMQLWTALDPVQFSFFAAAIAFAMAAIAHFLYLSAYLFDFSSSKEEKQKNPLAEPIERKEIGEIKVQKNGCFCRLFVYVLAAEILLILFDVFAGDLVRNSIGHEGVALYNQVIGFGLFFIGSVSLFLIFFCLLRKFNIQLKDLM